ncbi:MAG: hypothetical protein Fur0022_23220 [Anaerolineales bacterium]
MQTKKTVLTILVVVGLALILVGISSLVFPDWLGTAPGGLMALLGVALVAVAALGGPLKNWREFLFPDKEKPADPPRPQTTGDSRIQEMKNSAEGEQVMRGKGGPQKQKMDNSPRGKQRME